MSFLHVVTFTCLFAALLASPAALAQAQVSDSAQTAVIDEAEDTVSTTTDTDTVDASRWFTSDFVIGNPLVGDFVVGPGRVELRMKPGETVVTYISVTNRIADQRTFKLEVADVTGSSDGSKAINLVEDGVPGPYSIREFISFPEDTFTLALGERARIPVTVTLPPSITPGGLYGTVLVSTVQAPEVSGEVNMPRNPIIARVGSHIFIDIDGEKNVSGSVVGLTTLPSKWWYESGPLNLAIAYENTGSVHLNPYGEISVTNIFGDEVGYIELEPWFVLPTSLRTREVEWDRDFLFGRYNITAQINRGYEDVIDVVSVAVWVLPWRIMVSVFGGLFFIILLVKLFFSRFEFRRK